MILECRLELQKLLGHTISDGNLRKAASLAVRLSGLQPGDHEAALFTESHENGSSENLEFGADLVFQTPARFLMDISLDDGELLGVESTQLPSSHHGEWFGRDHFNCDNSAVDGGRFNLSWLRDECDQIVRESSSQLSQDELAMAICRVLDSGKPGEEV